MKPEGHLIPTNELVFDINIDMILVTEIVHISLFRPKGVCIVLPFFMGFGISGLRSFIVFQLSLKVVYVQRFGAGKLPAEQCFEGDI